jgi:type IV fimbrial biogenesis protein FimT
MHYAPAHFTPFQIRGLTLVELIVALCIFALLITLGIPSYQKLSVKNQQTSMINSFITHFSLARSLAVKRQAHQMLCPTSDGKTCLDNDNWTQGLIIIQDNNKNRNFDPDEPILGVFQPDSDSKIVVHSTGGRTKVIYHGDGRQSGFNLTLTFCDSSKNVVPKAVIVSNIGRIKSSLRGPGGRALVCRG